MFSIANALDSQAPNAILFFQDALSQYIEMTAKTNNSPLAIVYNPENGLSFTGTNRYFLAKNDFAKYDLIKWLESQKTQTDGYKKLSLILIINIFDAILNV